MKAAVCYDFGKPPTKPGLGVELNEEVAAKHPYTGKKLHLEPLDRPL